MSLISLIVTLVIVGVILYLINWLVPMDAKVKKILNIVVVIVILIWLAYAFGLLPIGDIKVKPIR